MSSSEPTAVIDSNPSASHSTLSLTKDNLSIISNTTIYLPPRTVGGIRDQIMKVKKCNCKRSNCLKLYCECFSGGIVCSDACCCSGCLNVEVKSEHDKDNRMDMIQATLDRNQHAFRPKSSKITTSQKGYEARGEKAIASLPGETRGKRTKVGCNCRKSKCLKLYCQCFEARLYCTTECRCNNCKNIVGDEAREKLIKKANKKDEEAISGTADQMELSVTKDIGGVSASTVAIVSAGVVAGGVDVFLPPSSYARPMSDDNGAVVTDISFGRVGRQTVHGTENKTSDSTMSLSEKNIDFGRSKIPYIVDNSGRETDLNARFATLAEDIALYHSCMKSVLKATESGNKDGIEERHESGLLLVEAAQGQTVTDELKTDNMKRSHEQFALKSIHKIVGEVNTLKKRIDNRRACMDSMQQEGDSNSRKSSSIVDSSSNQSIEQDQRIQPFLCKEEFQVSRKGHMSVDSIKNLSKLAEGDIILYNELSRALMERAVELSNTRKKRKSHL